MAVENPLDPSLGKKAIVVGSGIGGLLAARVLADFFKHVIVIERDPITALDPHLPRKGVPQGAHSHLLMMKGLTILNTLFPNFDEIQAKSGAQEIDMFNDIHTYIEGKWMPHFSSKRKGFLQSRPLLESQIRSLVASYHNITFLYDTQVYGLLVNEDKTQIRGASIKNTSTNQKEELLSDLIIDASGRNTNFPVWLKFLGYDVPKVEVKNDIYYSSRVYQCPALANRPLKCKIIRQFAPYKKRSSLLIEIEKNGANRQWLVTLIGQLSIYPENTEEDFIEFARQLEQPDVYDFIKQAIPVSPINSFRSLSSFHYCYEKAYSLPTGFIVLGDAFYTFNPIFGQGMSACTISADILNDFLLKYGTAKLEKLQKNYFKRTAKVLNIPWTQAMKYDFVYPEVEGKRPFGYKFNRWYRKQLFKLTHDPLIWTNIYRILNLEESPLTLFHPRILFKVLGLSLKELYRNFFKPKSQQSQMSS